MSEMRSTNIVVGSLVLFIIAACEAAAPPPAGIVPEAVGRLEDSRIREASGLARSQRQPGILWIINDNGAKEIVHAIDHTGARLGEFDLKKSRNKDWEDLASVRLDGKPYLMVADIGDNDAKHGHRTLYFVEEPSPQKKGEEKLGWRVRYVYPDGPRDSEAAAIDIENNRALILSKRDLPPRLYEVPLQTDKDEVLTATSLGTVESLFRPTRQQVEFAPKTKEWFWQPVGMDISEDNLAAVILTYHAVYYYQRQPGQDWLEALNTKPARISIGNFKNAESIAFGDDKRSVFVTGENKHSLLLRIDLNKPATESVTVMSFNVQNLFDNIDDPGKDDKAYLPLAAKQTEAHIAACNEIEVDSWRDECLNLDWSDAAIDHKLDVLAGTIRQVNAGSGADIIAMQEVENVSILERLRTEKLADLDYLPAILVEGTDIRGIDVAILSKLPLASEPQLHPLALPDFPERKGDTRGVLQATFVLPDDSLLTAFAVHFPAPFHPTAMREAAYEHLAGLLEALPDDHHAFAAGDFNTTSKEDEREGLLDAFARPYWTLAHDVGCSDCDGSYFYRGDSSWSFLDMIFFSPARGAKTTAQIRGDSVRIANGYPPQVSKNGTPERFRSDNGTGVSDHWPMTAAIELTEKQ
jgi:endonuclease/exonuclease/phosphatase family metal-dependent hydrolase